jgi:hypothetical protein
MPLNEAEYIDRHTMPHYLRTVAGTHKKKIMHALTLTLSQPAGGPRNLGCIGKEFSQQGRDCYC